VDRQARQKMMEAQIAARERHARMAQGTLTVLSTPIRAILETLNDPVVLQNLRQEMKDSAAGAMNLLGLAGRLAATMPSVVAIERLALGMVTDVTPLEDRPEFVFAQRIPQDPEATELAIRLLDRISAALPARASAE
jgi:hypothetical protein